MPIVRYFVFTGALLLGLLFLADGYFPKAVDKATADVDRSVIRIHSDHRWPAAVRMDTSAPMPVSPAAPAVTAVNAASDPAPVLPAVVREAKAYLPAPAAKPPEHRRRHVRHIARITVREPRAHLAYQSNWSVMAR